MHASVSWLNSLLSPGSLSADSIELALTNAGFPIESRVPLPSGDSTLDVEITSNRGDCLSITDVLSIRLMELLEDGALRQGSRDPHGLQQ